MNLPEVASIVCLADFVAGLSIILVTLFTHARTRTLARALVRTLVRDPALVLDIVGAAVRAVVLSRNAEQALAQALARDLDQTLYRGGGDLSRALDRARDRARVLLLTREFVLGLHSDDFLRGLKRPFGEGRVLGRFVRGLLGSNVGPVRPAPDFAEEIETSERVVAALQVAVAAHPTSGAVEPARTAVRVVMRMLRVLPASQRDRYSQEYRAELHILAQEGATRRIQLSYVLRVAMSMRSLRQTLRTADNEWEMTR